MGLQPVTSTRPLEDLARAFRELTFLQRISVEAATTGDYDEMLRLIIHETTGVMSADVCSLYLLEPDGYLVLQATNGLTQHAVGTLRLRLGEGITGWVARERQPLAVEDVHADSRFVFIPGVDDDRLISMLSVPVIARDRVVGVLNIQTAARRRFDEGEVAFLQALASQVAGLIEVRRLHREAAGQLETLQTLFRISSIVNSTLDLDELLERFLAEAATVFPDTLLSLLLLDDSGQWLHLRASRGFAGREARPVCRLGEGIGGAVVASGRPVVVEDLRAEPNFALPELVEETGVRSLLSVPLLAPDAILGTLHIYSRAPRRFSPADAELASALANQAALAIRNAQRYDEERRAVQELNVTNRRLHRAFEIHEQFTHLVLADRGIEAIAQTLADLLGERVLVESPYFEILAAVRPQNGGDRWSTWQPLTLSTATASRPDVQGQLEQAVRLKRPVTLGPFPEDGLVMPRTVLAIAAGRQHFGFVSVIHERPLENDDGLVALEQAATVLALEFLKQKVAFEVEQRLRGDLVELLLISERPEDLDRLQAQAAYLGLNLRQPYVVLLADLAPTLAPARSARYLQEPDLRWLLELLEAELRRVGGGGLAVLKPDAVAVILPASLQTDPPALARQLHASVAALLQDASLRLALSDRCQGPSAFRTGYRQARRTLDTMRKAGMAGIMSVRDLGPYQLLLAVHDDELLAEYARRELGPLLDYDERHGTDLVKTLAAFLRCSGSLKRTAQELYIHINTLAYRLQRIREITGIDLGDAERRMALHLALLILQLDRAPAAPPGRRPAEMEGRERAQ